MILSHRPSASAPVPSKSVVFLWLCMVPLHRSIRLNLDRPLNNGPTLRILSTPSRNPNCLRHPPPSRAPSRRRILLRGIAGNALFAQIRSPVFQSGKDTNWHTSRISSIAHFRIAYGGEIVPRYSRSTGSERITALTTNITVTPPTRVNSRHTTHGRS